MKMAQWIAVPECPGCGEVMRPDEEYDDFFQCIGCGFVSTQADLAFLGNDEDEDDEDDDE